MCAVGHAVAAWPAPDWSRPWNEPFAADGAAVRGACEEGVALPLALNRRLDAAGPRFVPQGDLPEGMAYEQFIFDTGAVPTREGLHDFFNGLVWARFPSTKRLLNRLQAAQIAQAGVGQVRGPVRDAITLFDENALLLQAPDPLWEALVAREWTRLFVDLRPLWAQARLVAFGHALLEKLVSPYKSITGHVYRAPVPADLGDGVAAWDRWLAARLTATELAAKPFTPLPVLGVPGWWPANEDPAFYGDATVFRPPRSAHASST
jgi:hypothetical protein